MISREELVNRIWGENAQEVLDFLEKVAPEKKTFKNENSLLNHLGRWLVREIKKSPLINQPAPPYFWESRTQSIVNGWEWERPKNILYVIRLLTGKRQVPSAQESEKPESFLLDVDCFDEKYDDICEEFEEEKRWEDLEKKRERWAIKR